MNSEEQTLIDGLFGRLRQAEVPAAPRDAQAQARITEHLQQQPAAPYYMAQAILVQEAALKRLDEQNKQLQAELKQAKAQVAATTSNSSGGFLSSIFGSGTRDSQPVQAQAPGSAPGTGGWREPARGLRPSASGAQGFNAAPAQAPSRSGASSFLGGALQTAAGVAGGVMLAQGISSLFNHHSQPEEVVEVIKEEPAPASDSGWVGNDEQRLTADNSDYGNDQGGFMDSDYGSDDGGFFDGDDSFV